ncbi:spermidine resistance protein [Mortierella sp. 14UC]|nr:spermidine resistance protein [Mortierella sp. 14UC]
MAVPVSVPIPSTPSTGAVEAHHCSIQDLKAALAASAAITTTNDTGDMSDNDDITPSTAAIHIPWSSDSFLDTSADEPMEPGSFEGPEKLLEIHFSPRMQDVQHIRTPLTSQAPFLNADVQEGEQDDRYGLRIIPKAVWEEMLDIVQCKVLHSTHTHPSVDAYVLSESSFFVFPHKLILKTCGTTTLLMALPKILELAQEWCGLLHSPCSNEEQVQQQQQPYRVFYSRKKFLFPEKQVHVHREWKDEVEFLDRHFNNGSAYTIGKVNGDHWCLYVTAPFHGYPARGGLQDSGRILDKDETAMENFQEESDITQGGLFGLPPTRPLSRASSSRSTSSESESEDTTTRLADQGDEDYDQTIEILMTDLNPTAMHKFYHHADKNQPSGSEGGQLVDQQSGLAALFPEAEIDSFLFQPCGYSCNALVKPTASTTEEAAAATAAAGKYFTIHVTPEPVCSYASFETNIPVRLSSSKSRRSSEKTPSAPETVNELVQRVIDIFQPGNLTVTIFASDKKNTLNASEKQIERRQFKMLHSLGVIPGFRRTDRILYGLDGYDLIYGHYLAV